jgi:hypothetical protein
MLQSLYAVAKLQMEQGNNPDCAKYMGFPPKSALTCSGMHGVKFTCTICRWNFCQGCLRPCEIICVRCYEETCEGCTSEPKFRGWNGVCIFCKAKGFKTPQQMADVIVIEEEKPLCSLVHMLTDVCAVCKWNCCIHCSKPKRLKTGVRDYDCNCTGTVPVVELLAPTPPTSPRQACQPLNAGDFWQIRTADTRDEFRRVWVTDSVEYQRVKDIVHASLARGHSMAASLPHYHVSVLENTMDITSIFRIENPVLMELFRSAERMMVFASSQRPDGFAGSPVAIAFHGTDAETADKIERGGFKLQYNEHDAYGLGEQRNPSHV